MRKTPPPIDSEFLCHRPLFQKLRTTVARPGLGFPMVPVVPTCTTGSAERKSGSDPATPPLRPRPRARGHYRVTGRKSDEVDCEPLDLDAVQRCCPTLADRNRKGPSQGAGSH